MVFFKGLLQKQEKIARKTIKDLKKLKLHLAKGAEKGEEDNNKYMVEIENFVNKTLIPIVNRYLGK